MAKNTLDLRIDDVGRTVLVPTNRVGSNQYQVSLPGGDVLFVSYQTPVAAVVGDKLLRTEQKFSTTTTIHLNKWLAPFSRPVEQVPQAVLYDLARLAGSYWWGKHG